jgi:hypothetical protein
VTPTAPLLRRWQPAGLRAVADDGLDRNQLPGITGLAATAVQIDGVRLAESTGHSGYLTPDSTSQYGMAAVVAGLPDLAPRDTDEGRGLGDLLATPLPEVLR